MSFKSNVTAFWDWFEGNYRKLGEEIKAKAFTEVHEQLSGELDKVFGNAAFLIGGGEGNFELIVSPEGNKDRLFLSRYWKEGAPEIPGWSFFNLKPPGAKSTPDFEIKFKDSDISLSWHDLYILPKLSKNEQKIDIEIYCEKLSKADEQLWASYVFISLDNCLGEAYVDTAIGRIEPAKKKTRKMISLASFYDYLLQTFKDNGWQLYENPDEVFSTYSLNPKETANVLREDIIMGYTCNTSLISAYLNGDGESMEYMRSVGAEYAFLAYEHKFMEDSGKIVGYRGGIEDALETFFDSTKLGRVLGGATGAFYSYIDLLIFDVDAFNASIGGVLADFEAEISYVPFSDILTDKQS